MMEKWEKQDLTGHAILPSSGFTPFLALYSNLSVFHICLFSPSSLRRNDYAKAQ
jgi:hypothetical protein